MVSRLSAYMLPAPVGSTLIKNPPDGVPPTVDLESLEAELKAYKQAALARSKKAGEDIKTIDESMRRMKEREKGKAKAVEKVKRERDYTPISPLEPDDAKSAHSTHSQPSKPRLNHLNNSISTHSARSSVDPRRSAADDAKHKKKKRKRDEDSDMEIEPQRPRKSTPPVTQPHPPPPKPQKSASTSHSKLSVGPDFTVPPPNTLLPPRPQIPPIPVAGPSKPTEVMEDFSKLKQPAQTVVQTFYTSIEPWIRNIREEDVGFLEYTGDEVDPYVMPKLGRHYLDVWAEQDAGVTRTFQTQAASTGTFAAPVPKWDPSTLQDTDLLGEEKGHGPLTERVISALLPMENHTWKGVKAAEDAMEGRPGGSGAAAARKEKMNVSDLETRIRDTMRYHGLLTDIPEYSDKVDDPIAAALRKAQDELRVVVATNKARKARLANLARDRLAYQEYLDLRDSIDRNINSTYAKLQKKDGPKVGRKKSKKEALAAPNGDSGTPGAVVPPPSPAALGLGPDPDDNTLIVSTQLKNYVKTRRDWVNTVGGVFEKKQAEREGSAWGFPRESVFTGVDEEVRQALGLGASGAGILGVGACTAPTPAPALPGTPQTPHATLSRAVTPATSLPGPALPAKPGPTLAPVVNGAALPRSTPAPPALPPSARVLSADLIKPLKRRDTEEDMSMDIG